MLFILLSQLVNGAKVVNITTLFLSSVSFSLSLSHAPVTIIVPLTCIYVSL